VAGEYGRLDYIFNNAGIGISGYMQDISQEAWEEMININLWGVIYGTQAAYEVMLRQGHGHIVNTASLAGLIPTPKRRSLRRGQTWRGRSLYLIACRS
jgi:NAD(P)-dependent dehydrogenase (short-subunit alcohol dehydrogenase family)